MSSCNWRQLSGGVGLDVGTGGLAELLSGIGMHEPNFEAALGEGVLDGMVIASGAFYGDEDVGDAVLSHGRADLDDGEVQLDAVVGDLGGRHEDLAIEVGQHPFGPRLGAIDADDAEVFGPDLLHARMNDAARLLDE